MLLFFCLTPFAITSMARPLRGHAGLLLKFSACSLNGPSTVVGPREAARVGRDTDYALTSDLLTSVVATHTRVVATHMRSSRDPVRLGNCDSGETVRACTHTASCTTPRSICCECICELEDDWRSSSAGADSQWCCCWRPCFSAALLRPLYCALCGNGRPHVCTPISL